MSNAPATFAKLAGIRQAAADLLARRERELKGRPASYINYSPKEAEHYFKPALKDGVLTRRGRDARRCESRHCCCPPLHASWPADVAEDL